MTIYLPRSAWTTHPKPSGLVPMPSRPKGIAVHWPGSTTVKIGHRSQANIASRLEGYRRFHVNGRGWTDVAYQAAVDQDGRVWDLRGIEHQSAANGDQTVNRRWLACLFLLGPGEIPSDEMRRAFADFRHKAIAKYPTATQVVGHQDIRPHGGTDCPGPITARLIHTGTLLTLSEENPMANISDEDAAKIGAAVADAIMRYPVGVGSPDSPGDVESTFYRTQSELMAIRNLIANAALLADSSVTDDPEGRAEHRANVVKLNVSRPWAK